MITIQIEYFGIANRLHIWLLRAGVFFHHFEIEVYQLPAVALTMMEIYIQEQDA